MLTGLNKALYAGLLLTIGGFSASCTTKKSAKSGPAPEQAAEEHSDTPAATPVLQDNREDAASAGSTTIDGDGKVNNGIVINTDGDPSQIQPTTNTNITPNTGGSSVGNNTGLRVTYKEFSGTYNADQIAKWVEADKAKRGADAAKYRYTSIPEAFIKDKKDLNYARVGLSKALNSVAVDATEIVQLEDASDGHGLVFAIPIEKMWGAKATNKWNVAAAATSKQVFSPAPRLDLRSFPADQTVGADRLAYNVLHGGVYNQLLEFPGRGTQLYKTLGADQITHRYGVQNAITYGPRYAQRRQLGNWEGGYWESFDDFNGRKRALPWITGNPIPQFRQDGMVADYGTVASEAWFHMKNGMPAYIIWGNANQERSKAEQSFVTDPLNHKGGDLVNGFCVFCHISGVQAAPNDIWTAIEEGKLTRDVERAKQFWTNNEELGQAYAKDRQIVVNALAKIVTGISDGDQAFNDALINGSDEREPCFFLVSTITGSRLRGDTTGLRRRNPDGSIGSRNNGRNP